MREHELRNKSRLRTKTTAKQCICRQSEQRVCVDGPRATCTTTHTTDASPTNSIRLYAHAHAHASLCAWRAGGRVTLRILLTLCGGCSSRMRATYTHTYMCLLVFAHIACLLFMPVRQYAHGQNDRTHARNEHVVAIYTRTRMLGHTFSAP